MKFEQYEYSIAGHYLPAIINDDYSGMSDEDETELNAFLDTLPGAVGGHWVVEEAEPGFQRDEVSGLMADCYDCVYRIPAE